MLTGRTFRLYPKEQQAGILSRWIGCQRVIRNAKIEETRLNSWLLRYSKFSDRPGNKLPAYVEAEENRLQAWLLRYSKFSDRPGNENEKLHDNLPLFDQAYSHFKTEVNPWLREVPSQILRNGVARAKAGFVHYWTGKAGYPKARGRRSKESVLLTSELFEIKEGKLFIGTARHPVGAIKWVAHREYPSPPKMITVWRHGDGSWALSFTCEDGVQLPTAEELLVQHSFTPEEKILALDAGVAHPLTDSEGQFYDLAQVVSSEVALCQQRKERLQGKLARQKKGSKNRGWTKKRIARTNARQRNVLEDWRQKTARRVVAKAHPVIGMENLRLASLTATPEPKPNPVAEIPGQPAFLPNGASAKAGLNKALLKVGLGQLRSIIGCKARRAGKAFLLVSPQFSSQECSRCTHTSPDNRPAQAEFHCQACGFVAHADYNASLVQRKRAHLLLSQNRPPGIGSRSAGNGAKMLGRERRTVVLEQEAPILTQVR